jgi:ABC-2 type transport system ATP-binding protein
MTGGTVAGRIGGLAVALGLGAAVVAGQPVASADSSGESSTDSPTSTSESASTSAGSSETPSDTSTTTSGRPPSKEPSDESGIETRSDTAVSRTYGHHSTDDSEGRKRARDSRPFGETVQSAAEPGDDTESTPKSEFADDEQPVADVVADASEASTAEAATAADPPESTMPEHLVSVEVARAVPAEDDPAAPVQSAAVWTLAAASRREFETPTPDPAPNDSQADPAVVAIEQTPPLAWLQHVPVVGPVFVTPIVTVLHQIPIVGDVLHPLIGYPVQFGLPAGSPTPRDVKVISFDGTPIYVHFMPASGLQPGQQAPTILNGPGLSLPGATNLDGTVLDGILIDAVGWTDIGALRGAGYNVVTWDPRGEWNSGGQLELNSADYEGRDVSAIISWLATQPDAQLDAQGDPRMGMTGISYGGGIQLVAAASDHRIDAIVPTISWNSLNTSLYKNEAFKSSWATLLTAALTLTFARPNPRIFPATVYGDLTGTMSQADQDLLTSRNPLVGNITAPTLLIQGTADTIFSLQEADATAQTLIANGVPTKVLWFCGGHGVCAHNLFDPSDGALIQQRTLEWLNRYVKGDAAVSTGPQFEWVDQRGQWFSSAGYPGRTSSPIITSSSTVSELPLIPYLGGSGLPLIPFAAKAPVAVNLTIPEVVTTTYVVGAPEVTLNYSGTGSSRHLYAQLIDDSTGFVIGSIATPIPVILDGNTHAVTVALEPVALTLLPGQTVTLQLVGSAGLYERIIPSLGAVTVSGIELTLPTTDAQERVLEA